MLLVLGPILLGVGLLVIVAAIILAIYFAVKGKPAAKPATGSTSAPAGPPTDPTVRKTLLQTIVQLERAGATQAAAKLKALWNGNKEQIVQDAEIEAEHLAQGGPMAVVSDLENMFAKALASKLADSDAAQALLNQIYTTLGPNHPAIVAFLQSIAPTAPKLAGAPNPAPAVAGTK